MHMNDVFNRDSMTFSFEFFPPSSEKAAAVLLQRIAELEQLRPSFVSVTYGAGGSTRDRTHELVLKIKRNTSLEPVPHLTCIGQSRQDMHQILAQYAKEGISNILALRGDWPPEQDAYDHSLSDFPHAKDLVTDITQFNASGKHPESRGFGIGVAGFPEGHPETPNRLTQMDYLKEKVDAGADYICTQMFFDNNVFYDWRDRCELAGITVPLVAGIMPITSIQSMRRMADLAAGTNFPASLQRRIYRCQDDPDAVQRVGVHWATEQCGNLIDNGIRGIHFYTLNQSQATLDIFRSLGVGDTASLRHQSGS